MGVLTPPTRGYRAHRPSTLMKSASDCLVRNIHSSGLLEVFFVGLRQKDNVLEDHCTY